MFSRSCWNWIKIIGDIFYKIANVGFGAHLKVPFFWTLAGLWRTYTLKYQMWIKFLKSIRVTLLCWGRLKTWKFVKMSRLNSPREDTIFSYKLGICASRCLQFWQNSEHDQQCKFPRRLEFVFWTCAVEPYSLVGGYWHFWEKFWSHVQCWRIYIQELARLRKHDARALVTEPEKGVKEWISTRPNGNRW